MRIRSLLLALLPAALLAVPGRSQGVRSPSRPNIVHILTDDQGWPDLSLHGNPVLQTPVLDRLGREGTRLTRFYASPVCTPTRAALMTGRYPQRTGAIDTYMGRDTLDPAEQTLPELLGRAGYRSGLVGKWHLGRYARYHPTRRGFDQFFGFWQYGFINRYFDSEELWEGRTPVTTFGYVTDVLTDRAIRFVRESRGRPFYLYLAYNAPHAPYLCPDPLVAKYLARGCRLQDAQIYGMVENLDTNVGRLLGELDRLGLRDDTLVVFMTDNGHVSGHYTPLRGRKGTVFEGGIRVPFFARWPGRIPAGRTLDTPAQHVDLFPTFLDAAGVGERPRNPVDGRSLLPLLTGTGPAPEPRYLYHQWSRVRPRDDQNWAIHDRAEGGRWKLANGLLFDLAADPAEQKDLAAAHPERAAALRAEFLRWFREVTAGRDYRRVPIEIGHADENPVEIDLTWGEAVGSKVQPRYRNYNRDYVADWSVPGEGIRWEVDVLREGAYEVELTYGCEPEDAGGRFELVLGRARLEGKIEPGGSRDVWLVRNAGRIRLPRGRGTLTIRALTVPGRELMTLHKLRLSGPR